MENINREHATAEDTQVLSGTDAELAAGFNLASMGAAATKTIQTDCDPMAQYIRIGGKSLTAPGSE